MAEGEPFVSEISLNGLARIMCHRHSSPFEHRQQCLAGVPVPQNLRLSIEGVHSPGEGLCSLGTTSAKRLISKARYPSGKGEVCKTFMRRFDSDPRLQLKAA